MTRNRRLHPIVVALVALLLALNAVVPAGAEESERPPAATEQTAPETTTPEETTATADPPAGDAAPAEPLAETAESPDDAAPGDAAAAGAPLDGEPSGEESPVEDVTPPAESETSPGDGAAGTGENAPSAESPPTESTEEAAAESPNTEEPSQPVDEAESGAIPAASDQESEQPAAQGASCQLQTLNHFRDVALYYGTVSAPGGANQDTLALSDHITSELHAQIAATHPDPIVTGALGGWEDASVDDMTWVLGAPEGLNPEQALGAAFEAFRLANGGGTLVYDAAFDRGTLVLFIESWTAFENVPGCADPVLVEHQGYARVSIVELNAAVDPDPCIPAAVNHERDMTIYYGTVSVPDGVSEDGLELTDLIAMDLAAQIALTFADDRVTGGIDAWVDPATSDMEWVLGAPEGLDAEQALLDAFEVFAAAQGGTLDVAAPVGQGPERYQVAAWSSIEPDANCEGGIRVGNHEGYANVTFVELNATVAIPEPATIRFRAVDQDGNPIENVRFAFTGPTGGLHSNADSEGVALFELDNLMDELVTGTFTLEFPGRPIGCTPPVVPPIDIDDDDLGTTVDLGDIVFTCAAGASDDCAWVQPVYVREMTVYYGTISGTGGSSADGLELSDRITPDLHVQIEATYADERVTGALDAWVRDDLNDMEWVLGTPDGRDAEQALLDTFEAFATGKGEFVLAEPIERGTEEYFLTSWTTIEDRPACSGLVLGDNAGYAKVTYVELNATVEPDPCAPREEMIARELAVYYGTATLSGGGASQNALSLSDHIPGTLRANLEADELDPRAVDGLEDWVVGIGAVEWVLAPPEALDAEERLVAAFEAFRQANGGVLDLHDAIVHGTSDYRLASSTGPISIPDCDSNVQMTTFYVARVTYVELNGTVQPDDSCEPRTTTHTREVTAFYGTVQHAHDNTFANGLALSDHINNVLEAQIAQDNPDPRVTAAIGDWVSSQNALTWVFESPEGLDAEQTLRDRFTAFSTASGGTLTFDDPIDRGTTDYVMAIAGTARDEKGCGIVIDPIRFVGRVSYVELNATVDVDDDTAAPGEDEEDDDSDDVAKLPNTGVGPMHATPVSSGALLFVMGLLPFVAFAVGARRRAEGMRSRST